MTTKQICLTESEIKHLLIILHNYCSITLSKHKNSVGYKRANQLYEEIMIQTGIRKEIRG